MSRPQRPYDEAELQAYVDGELPAVRSAEVAGWLSRHPEARAVAEELRHQNAGLRALFDPLLQEPVPSRLRETLEQERPPRPALAGLRLFRPGFSRPGFSWPGFAALLLLVSVSAAAGWLAHGFSERQQADERLVETFLAQIQSTYALYAVASEQGAIDEARLERLLGAATERLQAEIRRPQPGEGYRLLDGRLVPVVGGAAAVFLFTDPEERLIALYVQSAWDSQPMQAQLAHRNDLTFYYWVDGPLAYALAAPVEEAYLRDLGARLYPPPG